MRSSHHAYPKQSIWTRRYHINHERDPADSSAFRTSRSAHGGGCQYWRRKQQVQDCGGDRGRQKIRGGNGGRVCKEGRRCLRLDGSSFHLGKFDVKTSDSVHTTLRSRGSRQRNLPGPGALTPERVGTCLEQVSTVPTPILFFDVNQEQEDSDHSQLFLRWTDDSDQKVRGDRCHLSTLPCGFG